MATFSGGILPRQEQLKRPTDQQIIRERRDFVKDPQSWMDTAGVWNFGGAFTNMLPVTLIKKSYQGGLMRSFFDDYYNRLYFLPSSINLGAISTTVTKEFRVWIDSQTREEIRNGIKNAHELAYYDKLSDSAYARAIEDYLGKHEGAMSERLALIQGADY